MRRALLVVSVAALVALFAWNVVDTVRIANAAAQQPMYTVTPTPITQMGLTPGYAPDVPPREWDGPETENVMNCGPLSATSKMQICNDDEVRPVHHRTCADTSRFLMMSEDGHWHCLKFWPDAEPPR